MNENESEENDEGLPIVMKVMTLVSLLIIPLALGSLFLIDVTENTQEVRITEDINEDEVKLQIGNVEESTNYVIVRSSTMNKDIYQDTTLEFDRDNTGYVTVVAVKEDVSHPYFSAEKVKEEVFYNSY